ncbi:hypothetical protein [Nocardia bovistercoris]|uniref:Uncharacterized protein n=1 Tax=Nocardia bovistercoris TaxID=2785916 RepID=A0A931I7Y9_9NOCA|nr:hypothetical protein [Nocardia bovistercoris]MBH0775756.1 hypothetical protein [Nocardia bovistercoris]
MSDAENAVVVFTGKSFEKILREGGSQAWKLDPSRAKKCEWLVCTQNAHNYEDYADGVAPHRSAFLIGRISRVSPATDPGVEDRWLVEIGEYAPLAQPEVWGGDRNPVRYTTLDALGIDLEGVKFQKLERETTSAAAGLTIAQAKAGLAATYGVSVDSIEIVIRG